MTLCGSSGCGAPRPPLRQAAGRYTTYALLLWSIESGIPVIIIVRIIVFSEGKMRIKANICYNLDVLCFINIMTADKYYVNFHKELFDKYYPLINKDTKQDIQAMIKEQGYSMLSPTLTLFVSSLPNFENENLVELLGNRTEIEYFMNKTPYDFSQKRFDFYFKYITSAIIPLIKELENAGLSVFWTENKFPLIKERCEKINEYLKRYEIEHLINQFKDFDSSDFTVYLGSFVKPHGIKLCGNNLISDISYSDKDILSNVTHEAFHPAFDFDVVKPYLNKLAKIPWVKHAFDNQNPNSGYYSIDGFIEEHIVEALGIYVLTRLGVDINPAEYFKAHDEGSHVISPYFYEYLCEIKKEPTESFESYFTKFVDTIDE